MKHLQNHVVFARILFLKEREPSEAQTVTTSHKSGFSTTQIAILFEIIISLSLIHDKFHQNPYMSFYATNLAR